MMEQFFHIIKNNTSLSKENLEKLRSVYIKNRPRLIQPFIETKLVDENQVLKALSLLYSIPFYTSLSIKNIQSDWTAIISRQFLKQACIIPIVPIVEPIVNSTVDPTVEPIIEKNGKVTFAVNDPSDLNFIDDIAALLHINRYLLVLAPRQEILSAINSVYDSSGENAQQLVDDMEENGFSLIDDIEKTADLLDDISDAPVIRLVNHIISQAVKANASDIHIEPFQEEVKVRYRVDGILYEVLHPPKGVQAALISRIKVMAKMNIAEKRVPQDGRAQVRIGDQEIDIRISTIPISYGERLVMRLLNKSGYFLKFSQFGLCKENYTLIDEIIQQNNGIVLVTGPTGSGKTTTLYAALSKINTPEKKHHHY